MLTKGVSNPAAMSYVEDAFEARATLGNFLSIPLVTGRSCNEIPAENRLFDPRAPAVRCREPQHQLDAACFGELNGNTRLR